MSLNIELSINNERIGVVEITRASGDSTDPDAVNVYRWLYYRDFDHPEDCATSRIEHRYGDGAVVLAHKVLEQIALRHQIATEAR